MQFMLEVECRFQSQEAPGEQSSRQLGVAAEGRVCSLKVGVEQEPRDVLGREIHNQNIALATLELPELGEFPGGR